MRNTLAFFLIATAVAIPAFAVARSLSEIDLDERRINNLQAKTHRRLSVSC